MIIIMGACCALIIYLRYKNNMLVISPVVKKSVCEMAIQMVAVYQGRQLYIRYNSYISDTIKRRRA